MALSSFDGGWPYEDLSSLPTLPSSVSISEDAEGDRGKSMVGEEDSMEEAFESRVRM